MLVSIDSNVLAYAEGTNDAHRQQIAIGILANLPLANTVIPAQVLGELFNVLTRKTRLPAAVARETITKLREMYIVADTSSEALDGAMELASDHAFSIWDAIILAVSASAGCRLLLSEDMQHGFEWRGVTVVNPFHPEPHPLLARALAV